MEFEINNTTWTIKKVDELTINNEAKSDCVLGLTIYATQEIWLLENQGNIIRTLKHELMHAWLYEYAHTQLNQVRYHFEDVCNMVASSNDFINEVVEKFKKDGGNY